MLATVLKWLAMAALVHFIAVPIAQEVGLRSANSICTCTYTRIAGIDGFFPCDDAYYRERTAEQLLSVDWEQAALRYVTIDIAWRFCWLLIRGSVLVALYMFAVQSDELQIAVEQADRHAAALRARLRFVSHECRVPLNSVVMGLEFARDAASDASLAAGAIRRRRKRRGEEVEGDRKL